MQHGHISKESLEECLPALKRFAFTLTRNEDRASDLVQDCVERALRKAHLFDGANLRSWLFTVCRRIFLNQIRSEKVRGTAVTVEDAPQLRLAVGQTQEIHMHFQDVSDAFEKLPMNDKVVLSLVVIEGLKYDEVAALFDVPIGTVRSRLSRARARLQSLIEAKGEEEGTNRTAAL
jgi:RNA polymerase sigma-70 factor (ECF subfamily)